MILVLCFTFSGSTDDTQTGRHVYMFSSYYLNIISIFIQCEPGRVVQSVARLT